MLVNTFGGIDSTQLGESDSFTKISRTFFGSVGKILPDIRKKYFTEILVAVLLLALVLLITVAAGSAVARLLELWGLNPAGSMDFCLL